LYWQPNQVEIAEMAGREAAGGVTPKLQFSASQISPSALTFVAVTPCRLVDTRGAAAGFYGLSPFSGPSLQPSSTVTFPVQSAAEATANTTPAPCGTIPSIAQAYSFNITVIPKTGGGIGFVTVWPSGATQPAVSTLNDGEGVILANAAIVPAGTPSGGVSVFNSGPATTDVIIDMNGFYAASTDLSQNTAIGLGALVSNTTGTGNTASGVDALFNNTTGGANTATGYQALVNNTTGNQNTANGLGALQSNTTGSENTANGFQALASNTAGTGNTASGVYALSGNTTGIDNTASGLNALAANTAGNFNTAIGWNALQANTIGCCNAAVGHGALAANTTGGYNTASGEYAMGSNTAGVCNTTSGAGALTSNTTGSNNVAAGSGALIYNTTGGGNTAIGSSALAANTTGGNNIAMGSSAAENVSGSNNNNIHIGSQGASGDAGVIRIGGNTALGDPVAQTSFFVAGVTNVNLGSDTNAVGVLIDTMTGQLGVASSSRRYKEDIEDMGEASRDLMRLRPVTFRYKKPFADGSKPVQYGLIAEEVDEVYPDLVAHSADGQIETVKYQVLDSMLLNEVQRQQAEIGAQKEELRRLEQQNASLAERLYKLEAVLGATSRASGVAAIR
jgi:hypothetical protein